MKKEKIRTLGSLSLLFGLGCCITLNTSTMVIAQETAVLNYKLRADLSEVLKNTPQGELVPITIIMKDQADRNLIQKANSMHNKSERRAYVMNLLQNVAAESQAELLMLLENQQALGNVGENIRPLWIHNLIGASVTPEVVYAISTRNDVDYINYDRPVGPEIFPVIPGDDQVTAGIECGVTLTEADRVWNELGFTGDGVIVGVIDTGMCLTHPDIQNQIWTNPGEIPGNHIDDDSNGFIDDINGWNFESNNNNVNDTYGHGSHVSGTVAGDGAQGTQCGMAPGASIQTLKFWNSFSGEKSVWDGMQYGVANNADILTASLGWPHSMNPDRVTWRTICENSIAAGVIVIYAAHNYGCSNPPDDVTTPGDVPDVLTVGAVDCSDVKASFSSCGPSTWQGIMPWNDWPYPPGKTKPTISATGVNTVSHNFCSGYTQMSGTSMATPHVAGAVALMLEANPNLDQFDVKQILMDTAKDLGAPGMDNQTGAGRINAYEAVLVAMSGGGPFRLNIGGSCPGIMNADTSGSNQGDRVAYAYAYFDGSTNIPICPGLTADLFNPVLLAVKKADANGDTSIQNMVPAGACGKVLVQAFNVDTCEKSKVIGI